MLRVSENSVQRSITVCIHYKIKESEMGWICSTYVGEEEFMQDCGR